MKKLLVVVIIAVVAVESFLLARQWLNKNASTGKTTVESNDGSTLKQQLLDAREKLDSSLKEKNDLRKAADENTRSFEAMKKKLDEMNEVLAGFQKSVDTRLAEFQQKATALDEQRKKEKAELNKRIRVLSDEKVSLAAQLNGEIKKRDATIAQMKKSAELTGKVLNEERELTADLKKQIETEKGKATTLAADKVNLGKTLEAEKKKSTDLAAENTALKKQIEELKVKTGQAETSTN